MTQQVTTRKVKLINWCHATRELYSSPLDVNITPYIGKIGVVEETYDTGYDTDRPTGYEPVLALVNFGSTENPDRLWIAFNGYNGFYNGKDQFTRYLQYVE